MKDVAVQPQAPSNTVPPLTPEWFTPAPADASAAEAILRPSTTFWRDAWLRFRRNRLAMLGLILLAFLAIGAIFGPVISYHFGGKTFDHQDYANFNKPPSAEYWFGTDQLGRDIFTRVWVGGRISLAGSVEARIYLQYNLELALFFDAGSLRRTFVEPVTDNTRYSYGAGLRYITPIGPVGLLYGRKIDPEPSESPDRWHFSIGYTF